jgi:hypothetical protein
MTPLSHLLSLNTLLKVPNLQRPQGLLFGCCMAVVHGRAYVSCQWCWRLQVDVRSQELQFGLQGDGWLLIGIILSTVR